MTLRRFHNKVLADRESRRARRAEVLIRYIESQLADEKLLTMQYLSELVVSRERVAELEQLVADLEARLKNKDKDKEEK